MHNSPDCSRGRIALRIPRRAGFCCASIAFIATAIMGCSQKSADTPVASAAGGRRGKGSDTGPVPVVVATAVKKDMPLGVEGIGAVESMRNVAVKSLVSGTLMKVNFQEGQEVRKGDLLFEIDPRSFENMLLSAEADLLKTTALLEAAEEDVTRYAALSAQGMVSKEQFQNIKNTAHTLRATLAANQAAIANAKLQLGYCSLLAPCDGRTGSLGAHEGDLVRPSDANVSLVTVTQLAPIYVTFALPQQTLPTLQRYQSTGRIEVQAAPSAPDSTGEKGRLTFLDSSVDAVTGTVKLKATFDNEKHNLWPGQFVSVKITLATIPNQIVVPTVAVQNTQRGPQIFVVREDKTVELRPVTLDRTEGAETIVAKGLKEGEVVVIDGQMRLRSNSSVNIRPPVEDVASVRRDPGSKGKRDGSGKKEGAKQKSETPLVLPTESTK